MKTLNVIPKSISIGEFTKWTHPVSPTAKAVKKAFFTWFLNMDRPQSQDGRSSRMTMRGGFIMQRQENGVPVEDSYYVRFPSQLNKAAKAGTNPWFDYITDAEKGFGSAGLVSDEILTYYREQRAANRINAPRNQANGVPPPEPHEENI